MGDHLYRLDATGWASFTPIPTRRRKRTFHATPRAMTTDEIPIHLAKATVYSNGTTITVTGSGPIDYSQRMQQQHSSKEFWNSWNCEYRLEGSAQELKQAIEQGVAVAVSDGSYQLEAGAAAWTIEGCTAENRIYGAGKTPGMETDHSAYRSELFGLWGILMSLHQFTTEHQIVEGQVTVACDGLSALRKAQANHLTEPSEAHYDLISAIRELRHSMSIQLVFQHVKGHQDSGQTTVLPRLAWMNIEMDECAKKKVLEAQPMGQVGGIPHEGWVCIIDGKRIIKHLTTNLRKQLNGTPILNHWSLKQRFQKGQATDVDWEMAARTIQALPRAKQRWVSKLASKFLPYGTNMARWKLRTQTKCPRCSCTKEDKDHIFRCPAESAVAVWTKALAELDHWMVAAQTHPQLRQEILSGLQQWHDEKPDWPKPQVRSSAVIQQDTIGWGVVLEGCLVRRWREEQDIFWKAIKSRKSSRRWTTALLTRLITTAWDMWQHRNKALHESAENKQDIVEADINQQIRQAYEQVNPTLPQAAKPLTRKPLARLLQFPATYKCQWMATLRAIRIRVHNLASSPPASTSARTNRALARYAVDL